MSEVDCEGFPGQLVRVYSSPRRDSLSILCCTYDFGCQNLAAQAAGQKAMLHLNLLSESICQLKVTFDA